MKYVIASVFCFLCSFLLVTAARADENGKATQDDIELLQGNWKVVALEVNGDKAPAGALKEMRWSFKNAKVEMGDPNGKVKASVKVDSSKTPKYIDLVALDGSQKGETAQGIFNLEKNRLTICFQVSGATKKTRPRTFVTEPNSGLEMITLERVKDGG